jgi:hypothetical protein
MTARIKRNHVVVPFIQHEVAGIRNSPVLRFAELSIADKTGILHAEGFTRFVSVDPETGSPDPHGITLDEPADEEEVKWSEEADSFFRKK